MSELNFIYCNHAGIYNKRHFCEFSIQTLRCPNRLYGEGDRMPSEQYKWGA